MSGAGRHLAAAAARTDVRCAALAAVALALAVAVQSPAARLARASRLESSLFVADGEQEAQDLAREDIGMYLPQRRWLYVAALGNPALAADAVWIKAADYVTREFRAKHRGMKFEWLRKLYVTNFELDPQWERAHLVAGMVLGSVRRDPSGALRLLQAAMLANPDSWVLPYQAGATCLLWPGHSAEALRYYREAVRRPGHPPLLERVIPRLLGEAGRVEAAVEHARHDVLFGPFPEYRQAAAAQLREFGARLFEMDLEAAARAFRDRHGTYPRDLAELRAADAFLAQLDAHVGREVVLFGPLLGELARLHAVDHPAAAVPEPAELAARGYLHGLVLAGRIPAPESADPYGLPYRYDPGTGTVRSTGLGVVRLTQTSDILEAVAHRYRKRKGAFPPDLAALARWGAEATGAGAELVPQLAPYFAGGRPPEHPFAAWGESYPYDPATGRIPVSDEYRRTLRAMQGAAPAPRTGGPEAEDAAEVDGPNRH